MNGKLRGITWRHTRGVDPILATARLFEEETGVCVTWDARSLHDFGAAPVDELAALYDLVVLDHPWAGFIAARRCFVPLEQMLDLTEFAEGSVGPSHDSYRWDGSQWALAIDAATPVASYRPDLLDGPPPRTWDEVVALARRTGRVACAFSPVDAISAFLSLVANMGANPCVSPDRVVDRNAGRRVLQALRDLRNAAHPESDTFTPIGLFDRMSATDEIAYCPHAYGYAVYGRCGYRPHVLRFADMPALGDDGPVGSHLGGAGLAVSARCEFPEVAVAYAARVAGAQWQRTIYMSAGGQPAHRAAWDDPKAACFYTDTRETIERAWVRPRFNGYIGFQYAAGELVHHYLLITIGSGAVSGLVRRKMPPVRGESGCSRVR